tara:strand:- start:2048 stop:3142 length:1095 start_codon:yes stop_codon:yes gene_type:complete
MKILIVGPSWVGDAVISQSLYKVIHLKSEDTTIDVLAPKWTIDIFERMAEVSETILAPFGHGDFKPKERAELGKRLKDKEYDQAIILPNSLKSSLVPFFADIPIRTGWKGEMRYFLLNDIRKLNKNTHPRMVDRFVALGLKDSDQLPSDIPYPTLLGNENNTYRLSESHGFPPNSLTPIISLCPGAEFGPSKRWPSEYYAEVAKEFLSKGWNVVLLGSLNDVPIGKEIEKYLPEELPMEALEYGDQKPNLNRPNSTQIHDTHFFNLIGKTKLVDAVDILKVSELVVSNDSGLMHIAASVDVPLIALYGPTSPEFTPPLSNKAKVIKKSEGFTKLRSGDLEGGYHQSLKDIKPKEVLAALSESES